MGLKAKDLLTMEQLSKDQIELVLNTAREMKNIIQRDIKKVPTLRGKTLITLFYEPSTRTRTSFELAGKYMSADVVNISTTTSSVVKGESLKDTGLTLERMGADLIVIRHGMAGAPALLASYLKARVINGGDGFHEHPTQALLDMMTIREKLGVLEGLKVAIIGDLLHSRVVRSNLNGLKKMGAMWVCARRPCSRRGWAAGGKGDLRNGGGPSGGGSCDLDSARAPESRFFPTCASTASFWTEQGQTAGQPECLVLHGSINRGIEISSRCDSVRR